MPLAYKTRKTAGFSKLQGGGTSMNFTYTTGWDAALSNGDLLFMYLLMDDAGTITPPSSITTFYHGSYTGASESGTLWIGAGTYTAGMADGVTFSTDTLVRGQGCALTGHEGGDPVVDDKQVVITEAQTSVNIPSITTLGPDSVLLWIGCGQAVTGVKTCTDPASFTNIRSDTSTDGRIAWALSYQNQPAQGATGPFTCTFTSGMTNQWSCLLAINPQGVFNPRARQYRGCTRTGITMRRA